MPIGMAIVSILATYTLRAVVSGNWTNPWGSI